MLNSKIFLPCIYLSDFWAGNLRSFRKSLFFLNLFDPSISAQRFSGPRPLRWGKGAQRRVAQAEKAKMKKFQKLSFPMTVAYLTGAGACLCVSLWQAKMFIQGDQGSTAQSNALVLGVFAVLLSSQVIARLTGQAVMAKAPVWIVLAGVLAVGTFESLSVGISTVSTDGNMLASSRAQNLDSPEYRAIQGNIERYQRQLDSIQSQADALPENYVTARKELNASIFEIQAKISAEQAAARDVNVATADQAFDRLAAITGVSQAMISLVVGLALSLAPLVMNLLVGSLSWTGPEEREVSPRVAQEGTPAKKPRARLRSVTS